MEPLHTRRIIEEVGLDQPNTVAATFLALDEEGRKEFHRIVAATEKEAGSPHAASVQARSIVEDTTARLGAQEDNLHAHLQGAMVSTRRQMLRAPILAIGTFILGNGMGKISGGTEALESIEKRVGTTEWHLMLAVSVITDAVKAGDETIHLQLTPEQLAILNASGVWIELLRRVDFACSQIGKKVPKIDAKLISDKN